MHSYVSDTEQFSFSVALRSRYLALGFEVTVLALGESLLSDLVCGVMFATRTCQKLHNLTNAGRQRTNARKKNPSACQRRSCLLSNELQLLLNMSVELDGEMPEEVQWGDLSLREDFADKVQTVYFCSCKLPVKKPTLGKKRT